MHELESSSRAAVAASGYVLQTRLLCLPHAFLGVATGFAYGWPACVYGLTMAVLASFVVFLPMTALILNGGRVIGPGDEAPSLSLITHGVLLALWTATAWGAAAIAPVR